MTTVDMIRARMRNVRNNSLTALSSYTTTCNGSSPCTGEISMELKHSTDLVQQVNQAKMDAYVQRKQVSIVVAFMYTFNIP